MGEGSVTEVYFYHLEVRSLEQVLPLFQWAAARARKALEPLVGVRVEVDGRLLFHMATIYGNCSEFKLLAGPAHEPRAAGGSHDLVGRGFRLLRIFCRRHYSPSLTEGQHAYCWPDQSGVRLGR